MVGIGFHARAVLATRVEPTARPTNPSCGVPHRRCNVPVGCASRQTTESGRLSRTAACGNLWAFLARPEPIALRAKELTTFT